MRNEKDSAAAATVGDYVYVFGGRRHDIERYDAEQNEWTVLTSQILFGRQRFAVTCVNSSIYLLGGHNFVWLTVDFTDRCLSNKIRFCSRAPLSVACTDLTTVSLEISVEALLNLISGALPVSKFRTVLYFTPKVNS